LPQILAILRHFRIYERLEEALSLIAAMLALNKPPAADLRSLCSGLTNHSAQFHSDEQAVNCASFSKSSTEEEETYSFTCDFGLS